jgi:hypothetical protein
LFLWFLASLVVGSTFAGIAVLLRRRFGMRGLFSAAGAVGSATAGVGVIYILDRFNPGDVKFAIVVLVISLLCACVVGSVVLERLMRTSTVPDPLAEIAIGTVAFVLAAGVGAFLAFGFFVPRIG